MARPGNRFRPLEFLTKPLDLLPADESTAEFEKRIMNVLTPLVTNAQPPILVEPSKGPFYDPAVATQATARLNAHAGDAGLDAALAQLAPEGPRDVGLVRMQFGGPMAGPTAAAGHGRNGIHQPHGLGYFSDVRRRRFDDERGAAGVDHKMALRARFAAIRWIRPGARPLFGAGTNAASSTARDQSSCSAPCNRSSKTRWSCSQTPAVCQACRRRQQVMPLPQPISWGNISQGRPVLSTNRIPVRVARLPTRGRPPFGLGFSAGKSGSITDHKASSISGLGMPLSCHRIRFC